MGNGDQVILVGVQMLSLLVRRGPQASLLT